MKVSTLIAFCFGVAAAEKKRVYHIQGLRSVINTMAEKYPQHMDVWKEYELSSPALPAEETLVDMTLYTTESFASKLTGALSESSSLFGVREQSDVDMDALIAEEKAQTAACRSATKHSIFKATDLKSDTFFDCFRPDTEVFAWLDKVVYAHSSIISKFDISKTYEKRTIPGYKISLNDGRKRKSIFIQGLLHAREWLAVPTTIYTMVSLIDGVQNKDQTVMDILNDYDFYFVPLVNIDGYRYSWKSDRMWRKNRRPGGFFRGWADGVDLNRNYGPEEFFCKAGASKNKWSQTYCGTGAFSEPETAGIEAFINAHPEIAGGIDVHCYGDMVLRPYGLSRYPTDEPHKTKLKQLGQQVADAVNGHANGKYTNIRASELYVACGTFMDSIFEAHGLPAITFELRGDNFVVKPSLIRTAGPEIFKGISAFVDAVSNY